MQGETGEQNRTKGLPLLGAGPGYSCHGAAKRCPRASDPLVHDLARDETGDERQDDRQWTSLPPAPHGPTVQSTLPVAPEYATLTEVTPALTPTTTPASFTVRVLVLPEDH